MEAADAFICVGTALGLGLLVGLQRERARSAVAGIRTFAIISLLGAVCGLLIEPLGPWMPAAGLLGVGVLALVGNLHRAPAERNPGVTTEAAMLLMFAVGVTAVIGPLTVAVVVGAACAVALHAKGTLHGFVRGLDDRDVHAIMQFAAISLVILPIVPDRAMGPFGALNPRHIWLLVVLVVGISLAGYVAYRFWGGHRGTLVSGLLGGLISSTAATASLSRRAAGNPKATGAAALAILLAWSVSCARVLVEVYAVAPASLAQLAAPIASLMGVLVAGAAITGWTSRGDGASLGDVENPTQLKSALIFAAIFAAVLVAVAAANTWFGQRGIYAVAAVSGLTDLDAITLSAAGMIGEGGTTAPQAGTAIVIALVANTIFKTAIAGVLGGRALLARLAGPSLAVIAAGVVIIFVWLPRL